MALTVVGTVPYEGFPLIHTECRFTNGRVNIGSESVPALRGTPALLAAACLASEALGLESPTALLAGDVGRGDGSRLIYAHLLEHLSERHPQIMVFHYLQPDVDWHNRILIN
jgi:hypothetical protein